MSQNHSPEEIVDLNIENGVIKANLPLGKMMLLGIMAGAFIAIGGAASNVAVHNIANVGIARTVAGAIFPIGLMMIVFVGGELFTGNCLIPMAVMVKRVSVRQLIRNLVVVFFSNLMGAFVIDLLVFASGQFNYTDGALGAYTIKVALGKVSIDPMTGIASGILCNIIVCMAIMMASATKDVAGRIWAIFFPIWAFVVSGYEHCVANMYYLPAGMLAATNPQYVAKAEELYGITAQQSASLTILSGLKNIIPVTIGNIIGGVVFVGLVYVCIHKVNWGRK